MGMRGADVVDVAGLGGPGPEREAVGRMTAWTFPPGRRCLFYQDSTAISGTSGLSAR
jgi:hypothetical protein